MVRPRLAVEAAGTHVEIRQGERLDWEDRAPAFRIVNRNRREWEGIQMDVHACPPGSDERFLVCWHEEAIRSPYGSVQYALHVGVPARLFDGIDRLTGIATHNPEPHEPPRPSSTFHDMLTVPTRGRVDFHIPDGILAPAIAKGADYILTVRLRHRLSLDREFRFFVDAKSAKAKRL